VIAFASSRKILLFDDESASIPNHKANSKVFSHKISFFSDNFSLYGTLSLRKQGLSDENKEGKCYVRKHCLFYAFCTSHNAIVCENREILSENRQKTSKMIPPPTSSSALQADRSVTGY